MCFTDLLYVHLNTYPITHMKNKNVSFHKFPTDYTNYLLYGFLAIIDISVSRGSDSPSAFTAFTLN